MARMKKRRLLLGMALFMALAPACAAAGLPEPVSPTPGPDLSGTYQTKIPFRDFDEVPGETLRSYAGTWYLTIDEAADAYRIEGDKGGFSRVSGEFVNEGETVVFNDEPAPTGAFNCYIEGERTLTDGKALYLPELEGTSLTLTVERDPCPLREAILSRTWEKA